MEENLVKTPVKNVTREKTKRVEVLLLPEIYDRLKLESAKSGYTMTTLIKRALEEYLKRQDEINC